MTEIKSAGTSSDRFLVVVVRSGAGAYEARGFVRFEVDWGHEWPLWGPGEEAYPMAPAELGLSQPLAMQLTTFYGYWEEHHPFEKGWDSLDRCRHTHAEAERLTALVAAELHERYVVVNGFNETFPRTAGLVLAH